MQDHSVKAAERLIDSREQRIGWSTGAAALTELIKQGVNAVLGTEGTIVNIKKLPAGGAGCIFKHQQNRPALQPPSQQHIATVVPPQSLRLAVQLLVARPED